MAKKILIITGDGGESYETLYAKHRFEEAGYQAVIAAPSVKRLNLVLHDFEEGWDTYVETKGYCFNSDILFSEINCEDYDVLVLIGGRAPEYLRNDKTLTQKVAEFYQSGKLLAAVCHGLQILSPTGLLKGKKVTCYEHVRVEMELTGAEWINEEAVIDGNLITAQTWQSHPELYRAIFQKLG